MSSQTIEKLTIGERIAGYEIPVINERAVRAAAGLLFLLGMFAVGAAWVTQNVDLLKPFGIVFMFDMYIRLFIKDKWSPSMLLGSLIVKSQAPEWVGAPQKAYAWGLGFGMALTACLSMGLLGLPTYVALTLCSICVSFLFLEAAFGICVGCHLQKLFSKNDPMYCPGGVCNTKNHNH